MHSLNNIFPENIISWSSQRELDFSLLNDQKSLTDEQSDYVHNHVACEIKSFVNIRQVHGNHVIVADAEMLQDDKIENADGLITNLKHVAIAVRTADCLPLFMHDATKGVIGIIHCGWKGAKFGITKNAVHTFQAFYQSKAEDIRAYVGPAIRKCCYEVSVDFKDTFGDYVFKKGSKYYFDLIGFCKQQVVEEGITESNLIDSNECTCCNKNYYSYRREGNDAGRMLSLMIQQ